MAITFVGSASGTNSLTEPAHLAGDFMVCFAIRDGSNLTPGSPAGYEFWWDNTANLIGAGMWEQVAPDATARSLTFTDATSCLCLVYRGVVNPDTSVPTPAMSRDTGTGTSAANVALTLSSTTSWVLTAKGTTQDGTLASANVPPAGCTQRVTASDATDELGAADTNGPAGTTTWAPAAQTISSASAGWVTFAMELIDAGGGSTETITVNNAAISVTGQTVNTPSDTVPSDTITVNNATISVTGQTVWVHVVDNPYVDLPVLTGTAPTGYVWPNAVEGTFETIDGKIAYGQKNDSQIPGGYIDFATHNGDQPWSFVSDNKYVKMEVRSGDQYYEDDPDKERSEIGTMRTYWDVSSQKYTFEWNSLFELSANNSAAWCTLFQIHPDTGGSPIIGIYFEGTDLVVITRSGSSGAPTENYRYSVSGGASMPLATGIYHRFTVVADFSLGIANAALNVTIDGVNRVNISGAAIGYTGTTKFRHYWGIYRAEAPETTSHQIKNVQVTVEPTTVSNGTITVTGQTVNTPADSGAADITTVDNATITVTGQTILETETIEVLPAISSFAGQTVNTPADSGGSDTITVDNGTITVTGQDVTVAETVPPAPVLANGGGGGPASDAAYHARQKYNQDKRDRETRLWKGEPPTAAPETAAKKSSASAKVKKVVTPVEEPVIDPLAEIMALLAQPSPVLLMEPRPSRYFDPEDDVAAILLTADL